MNVPAWALILIVLSSGCLQFAPSPDIDEVRVFDGFEGEGWALVRATGNPGEYLSAIIRTSHGSSPENPRALYLWKVEDDGELTEFGQLPPYGWEPYFGQSSRGNAEKYVVAIPEFWTGSATVLFGWYGFQKRVEFAPLNPAFESWVMEAEGRDVWRGGPLTAPRDGSAVEVTIPTEGRSLAFLHVRARGLQVQGSWMLDDASEARTGELVPSYVTATVDGPAVARISSLVGQAEMYAFAMPLPEDLVRSHWSVVPAPN